MYFLNELTFNESEERMRYIILNMTMYLKRILWIMDVLPLEFSFSSQNARLCLIFIEIFISSMVSFENKIAWQHLRSQWWVEELNMSVKLATLDSHGVG